MTEYLLGVVLGLLAACVGGRKEMKPSGAYSYVLVNWGWGIIGLGGLAVLVKGLIFG